MKALLNAVALLVVLASGLALAGQAVAEERQPAKNGYSTHKVVYHLNDSSIAPLALRNVSNHLNAVGDENVDIVVVTHGNGINFLLDGWTDANGNSAEGMVADLANRGVKFNVCAVTLTRGEIDENKVNMQATIVPSGVATVAELQHQGYVYVKP
jgi:uncharacterized protein